MRNPIANVTITESEWVETGVTGDMGARLLAQMTINGHPFHVEAIAVRCDEEGTQVVGNADFEGEFDGIFAIQSGGCGPMTTQEIRGREYVIVVTPHAE